MISKKERQRVATAKHYAKHGQSAAFKARQRWNMDRLLDRNRDVNDALKTQNPCTDCGGYFPSVCMDWDHTGDDKKYSVAKMLNNASLERLYTEINKCELVCANCHRIRTSERVN